MRLKADVTQIPFDIREMVCPVCGKTFFRLSSAWAYSKINSRSKIRKDYCSWKCLREAENAPRRELGRRSRPRLNRAEKYLMYHMFKAGFSAGEVAEALDVTVEAIYYHRKKMRADDETDM